MSGMQILRILEAGRADLYESPIPKPGKGEVLVKILGVTTCPHWDLHLMDGVPMFPGSRLEYPYTPGQPGHEAMGEVVALGEGVASPAVGAHVAAWRDRGHLKQGCYAQYGAFEPADLIEVPADLPPQAIAPLELAMCIQVSLTQLGKLDAIKGKRLGVSGLGPAGLVAVQMAKAGGAREVVGIDPLESRCKLARQLGADVVVQPGGDLPAGRRIESSLDAALDCTGLKASIEYLMDRTNEAVAIFGVLREDVIYSGRHWGGLSLLGYGSHNREDAERALALILKGALKLSPLVTHKLPLSRYSEGVELLRRKEAVKVCFLPWE